MLFAVKFIVINNNKIKRRIEKYIIIKIHKYFEIKKQKTKKSR